MGKPFRSFLHLEIITPGDNYLQSTKSQSVRQTKEAEKRDSTKWQKTGERENIIYLVVSTSKDYL